jgi:uncharacterized membrane protein (DUF4010 family)
VGPGRSRGDTRLVVLRGRNHACYWALTIPEQGGRRLFSDPFFVDPLIALGLGLLVGLQKERTTHPLAGLKTFGLASLFGAVAAILSATLGVWIVVAGLLAVLGVLGIGNAIQIRAKDATPGQTTEVALLVMYLIGALTVIGPRTLAIVLGGAVAVLLHLREELKDWVASMSNKDMRAIMQFVVVSLVILPVLPNRTMGPFDVLNPRNIWWMVVLIVGINLAGYAAFRWLSHRGGTTVAGLLGGIVSSTATTFAYARNARSGDVTPRAAAIVIWLASAVVYVRILIEIGAVAPSLLSSAAPPVLLMLGAFALTSMMLWSNASEGGEARMEPKNPTHLRTAIVFGVLYAGVLLAVAAAETYLGSTGLYATAVISGLTDIDAITLSTSRLVSSDRLDASVAWRLIVAASLSNLIFKLGVAWVLGGAKLARQLGWVAAAVTALGVGMILFWPGG